MSFLAHYHPCLQKRKRRRKSTQWNYLRCSPMNAKIFYKHVIFDRKLFKLQCYSSVNLQLGPKTNIRGVKENYFRKNPNLALEFFDWFYYKTIEHICFQRDFMTNQLYMIFPKKWEFQSWKCSNILTLL